MAPQLMQQFAACVGIDWADRKHDFCLQAGGEDTVEFGCLPHRVECIDEWARALHQRFGGPIAVALELAKGPIVSALQKYGFFTLFPINPSTPAKYRLAVAITSLGYHCQRTRPTRQDQTRQDQNLP